jgi:hydrogenase maturation protein HypF
MGRVFDAVAAILGVVSEPVSFEGQAAMLLQAEAEQSDEVSAPWTWEWIQADGLWQADWRPMVRSLVQEFQSGAGVPDLARRFHRSLVQMMVAGWRLHQPCARRLIVAGGCFQNKLLLKLLIDLGRQESIEVVWPQMNPPNDGGLALGQLAWWKFQQRNEKCV